MQLTVKRTAKRDSYTIGKLYIDGVKFADTMEDKDRGLRDDMTLGDIQAKKVYGQTAIPTGTYGVRLSISPRFSQRSWARQFGGKTPEIVNVKGFTGVRIHPLNTAEESLGCIGVGVNSSTGRITQSAYYFRLLMQRLTAATADGEKITLTISG